MSKFYRARSTFLFAEQINSVRTCNHVNLQHIGRSCMIRVLAIKTKTSMRAYQYAVVDHNYLADCMDCKIVHQFFTNEFCDPCSATESTPSESTPWYFVNEDLDDNALKQCAELHFPVMEHGANAQAIAKIGHDFIQYEFLNM